VLTNRFQLMARYGKDVIVPVLREERRRAGEAGSKMLSKMRTSLIRETSLIASSDQQQLETVLKDYRSLDVVYQFRLKLQNIWARSTASQKELVESLQEWCRQAEASGIESLREFVSYLKAYVPQRA
jgi:stearoyl-CoA desaturase (delta-9 desaturase)